MGSLTDIERSPAGRTARLGANALGRDFVVGDVHGHFSLLRDLLRAADFEAGRDRLLSVGDLIDRGAESREALEWLESGRFALAVMGNHEEMMLRALGGPLPGDSGAFAEAHPAELRTLWRMNGGRWWDDGKGDADRWLRSLRALPYAATVATPHGDVGLVHACPMWTRWADFLDAMEHGPQAARTRAVWTRQRTRGMTQPEFDDEPDSGEDAVPQGDCKGVRAVMVGHSPIRTPRWDANLLNLDTGVSRFGVLSMAHVNGSEITVTSVDASGRSAVTALLAEAAA